MAAVTRYFAQTSPKVGFVSLSCPKTLVDSERILTQLKVEGCEIVGGYQETDRMPP